VDISDFQDEDGEPAYGMFVNGPVIYLLPNNQFPIATKQINKLMLDLLPLIKQKPVLLHVCPSASLL
jgi:hypothetical protein